MKWYQELTLAKIITPLWLIIGIYIFNKAEKNSIITYLFVSVLLLIGYIIESEKSAD